MSNMSTAIGVTVPLGTPYLSSQISMKFPTIEQFGEAVSCGHLLELASHTVKGLGKFAKFVRRRPAQYDEKVIRFQGF